MKRAYVVAGVFGIVLILAAIFSQEKQVPEADLSSRNYSVSEPAWRAEFDRFGSNAAYQRFIAIATSLPYSRAHLMSHIVGELLFEKEGEKGVSICTPDFGFGCFHGLSGASIAAGGLDAIPLLEKECTAASGQYVLGCLHGVGHGILAYLGDDKIVEALRACGPVQHNEPIGGCYGGVIMEYDFHTLQSDSGVEVRPFDPKHANEPCVFLPHEFQDACFYELPSWWRTTFSARGNLPMAEQFKRTGDLCKNVRDSDLRTICFRGIGNIIGPLSEYKAPKMREWCDTLPAVARTSCYHEALNHLLQSDGGKAQLRSLCSSKEISFGDLCTDAKP